jgi:hypothetical protein
VVPAEVSPRLRQRDQLRWLVDRVGQPGGRKCRARGGGERSQRVI